MAAAALAVFVLAIKAARLLAAVAPLVDFVLVTLFVHSALLAETLEVRHGWGAGGEGCSFDWSRAVLATSGTGPRQQ